MLCNFLKPIKIKDKTFYEKEFSDSSRLLMTGLDFNFRKYNLTNTNKFLKFYEISEKKIAKTYQKHTKNVVLNPHPGEYYNVDGFVTSSTPIMIVTADCIPLLLKGKKKAALVHAGWRGVQKRIYFEAINKMNEDKKDIKAYLLPSISKLSFQVGEDFIDEFKGRYGFRNFATKDKVEGKYLYDLKSFVKFELINFGIKPENIFIEDIDTYCDTRFHSYRREGKDYGLNAIFYIV
ncbi:polyphenol oxidase family protein [Ezakiella coagulans]|uniref:polyphenol oxidase family protein n=1 Tax=Ezakiella coagulans TaxID=46507 RepID=UPI00288C4073|nr:polyphenol oxidase family protein [Ezakiella coagulans]